MQNFKTILHRKVLSFSFCCGLKMILTMMETSRWKATTYHPILSMESIEIQFGSHFQRIKIVSSWQTRISNPPPKKNRQRRSRMQSRFILDSLELAIRRLTKHICSTTLPLPPLVAVLTLPSQTPPGRCRPPPTLHRTLARRTFLSPHRRV